jgi:hypothetical protein
MELMQKYVKVDRAIGIDNLHRWRLNPDALGFLSAMTSATSAAELLKAYYFPPPPPRRPTPTVAASTPKPFTPEGVTHRRNIFGSGLYTRALQVCTVKVISELAMEVVFESKKYLLHYTFAELQNFQTLFLILGALLPFGVYEDLMVENHDGMGSGAIVSSKICIAFGTEFYVGAAAVHFALVLISEYK